MATDIHCGEYNPNFVVLYIEGGGRPHQLETATFVRLSAFRDRTANFEKTFAKVWPTPTHASAIVSRASLFATDIRSYSFLLASSAALRLSAGCIAMCRAPCPLFIR